MSLTIDCPPETRPEALIEHALDGIDVIGSTKTDISFGEVTFFVVYKSIDGEADLDIVRVRLINLYNQGLVRYAEWRCKKCKEKSELIPYECEGPLHCIAESQHSKHS